MFPVVALYPSAEAFFSFFIYPVGASKSTEKSEVSDKDETQPLLCIPRLPYIAMLAW